MQRYFIELAYNGAPFNGWQIQPNAPTIQEEIENSLGKIFQDKVPVVGCGRTDSGVHASQFFAHFESSNNIDTTALAFKLNCMLPKEIAIYHIDKVASDLHARFSAESRTYHYFINQVKDPYNFGSSWFMHAPLDIDTMNEACTHLLGKQDFTSFSKLHTQTKTNICTIKEAYWEVEGSRLKFTVTADRFLHNMVRAIVGTTVEVGRGKLSVDEFQEVITAKSRQKAGASVPAHGLFLAKVVYP